MGLLDKIQLSHPLATRNRAAQLVAVTFAEPTPRGEFVGFRALQPFADFST